MPEEIHYDANASPPQFTNNADMVIEPNTHIRVKLINMRTEVGEMWAIGTINGDFLGYVGGFSKDRDILHANSSIQLSPSLDLREIERRKRKVISPFQASTPSCDMADSILSRCRYYELCNTYGMSHISL